jgi:glutaminase
MQTNVDYQELLAKATSLAKHNTHGRLADYIPQLANVNSDTTAAGIYLVDGEIITHGDVDTKFTLQSVSKLVLLIGMLEEHGAQKVFSWINAEPSGQAYAAINNLDRYGLIPSNPLINAGAICLASRIEGDIEQKLNWVEHWISKIYNQKLTFCHDVFASELGTADRNRSIAYLMRSTGVLVGEIEEILQPYFALCSYAVNIQQALYLPMLLANGGRTPAGKQIIASKTAQQVIALMATCGLYDESGMNLVLIGLPSKSGVSGLIIATAVGKAGIAVYSPKVNHKGTSCRGNIILQEIAAKLDWHFANVHNPF